MAGVYGVYEAHQQSAVTQDEVVEVQQNIRIAMDQISRDIRNAGILIPATRTPIDNIVNDTGIDGSDGLRINTASASGRYAVIDRKYGPLNTTFIVSTVESLYKFEDTDTRVKIIRIINNTSEPPVGTFTQAGINTVWPAKTMTINTAGVTENYEAGDVIVGTTLADRPETITYCLGPGAGCAVGPNQCPPNVRCLIRIENNTASVVAANITNVQFSYLMDAALTEVPKPAAADEGNIRAVRVRLTGSTVITEPRERELSSIVYLRNSID
jgi:hypothetical protein